MTRVVIAILGDPHPDAAISLGGHLRASERLEHAEDERLNRMAHDDEDGGRH